MGLRLNTKIDRIAMITTLTKAEFNSYIPLLQALVKAHKGWYKIGKDGWSHRACIRFDGNNCAVHISIERLFNTSFLKYEFKPCDMTAQAFANLDLATSSFGKAGYRSCLIHGAVTYVEVAVDFVARHTSEILIFRPFVHAAIGASKKILSTYYLGSRTSAKTTVAYNRGEHPKASASEKAWPSLLRVEARLRRPKIVPVDLGAMENPFAQIHVCEYQSLIAKMGAHPAAIEVLKICQMVGSPQAFSIYPEQRKLIMKAAAANNAPWWRSERLMDGWESTVARQLGMTTLGIVKG
jgi:hypothetical protein